MAYDNGDGISVIDSADLHSYGASIQEVGAPWRWSPDGRFIAAGGRGFQNQPSLTRVTGANVSTPVGIYPAPSNTAVSVFWRP